MREITAGGVCVLAVAAAVATSTSYVLQPELPVVARDVGSSVPVIGVVAALPIGGYLFGPERPPIAAVPGASSWPRWRRPRSAP